MICGCKGCCAEGVSDNCMHEHTIMYMHILCIATDNSTRKCPCAHSTYLRTKLDVPPYSMLQNHAHTHVHLHMRGVCACGEGTRSNHAQPYLQGGVLQGKKLSPQLGQAGCICACIPARMPICVSH